MPCPALQDQRSFLRVSLHLLLTGLILAALLPARVDASAFDLRGAAPVRMSRAVGLTADPYSPLAGLSNPAAGSMAHSWAGGAAWSRSFDLPELDRFQLSASGPAGPLRLGFWAAGFGRKLYRERMGGTYAAVPLSGGVLGGLGISFAQVDLDHYGSDQALAADLGLLWPTRWAVLGAAVQNLAATPLAEYGNIRPARVGRLAADIAISGPYRILMEVEWEETREPTVRVGADFAIHDALILRVGIDPASERIHAGLNLRWNGWSVLAASDHHPNLAWSQAYGLSWTTQPQPAQGP